MSRRIAPDFATTRDLFVHSGNQCAFPACDRRLVNPKGQWVGEICHIEAASAGGERFNPQLSPIERAQRANLLLLCHDHHVETNDVDEFPHERLRQIKAEHEQVQRATARVGGGPGASGAGHHCGVDRGRH